MHSITRLDGEESKPLLSIVIANYNYGRFLGSAIESVVSQLRWGELEIDNAGRKHDAAQKVPVNLVELIICDGGSTDNSVAVIETYARGLQSNKGGMSGGGIQPSPIAWWCSEKDGGQSDAFNKGFSHARGRFLTWLNADDLMPCGSLKRIIDELQVHPECEWFTGNFYRFTGDGNVIECAWGPHCLPNWLQGRGQPIAVYGPTAIFAKELYYRVGGMKVYQNFMMDTDLWMRFIVAGVKQRRINYFCWAFRMHEESKTAEYGDHKLSAEQRARFEEERKRSYQETGYRRSVINHRLIQLWRIIDGSFLKNVLLNIKYKRSRFANAV